MTFSPNLIRLALGLSQQGLADKTGLHRVTIARIETGAVIPTLKTVITLAHVLGVEVQDLLK